jgi:hypothetical protein
MNQQDQALDICLEFSNEIFHNPDITNIIIRIEKAAIPQLQERLDSLGFKTKRVVRENKKYSIVNFEKVYPIIF